MGRVKEKITFLNHLKCSGKVLTFSPVFAGHVRSLRDKSQAITRLHTPVDEILLL